MHRETRKWIRKAEADTGMAHRLAAGPDPFPSGACFHCQQSAEKYLKALLREQNSPIPRTHDLEDLLDLLLPFDRSLAPLRRIVNTLTPYAVEYRYPGKEATKRQLQSALRHMARIRAEIRRRLGLAE